jgi:hypothetical protein
MTKLKLGLAAGAAALLAFGVAACGPTAPATEEAPTAAESLDTAVESAGEAASAAGDAVEGAVHEGAEAVANATDDVPAKAEETK